jgi:class 3 adenylate cyclase/tetratricopeptide (TPR) repeat protein
MLCPRCQHDNPPQAKFCLECGARFAAGCGQCGTQLPAGAKFCLECGKPTNNHETEPARFASPQAYTPKHLAEKILTSKAALEGERKQVTVLFADLKGSMELLADRDPEEARKLLDPVLERMMEAVHRYEGTVNQVMGDGIMALFGAPLAHEDHAVRACYAALRMQESVKQYADDVRRSHGAVVKIRVGLNSGEVVVRAIGSDLHMDYTAVGQTTHLAARMEQLADPGAIVITSGTLALAEGYVEVRSQGPVTVKGLADAVEIYEVTGKGPARTRLQAGARRGLTRFVGRDVELGQLRRAQQIAGTGHGQVAAVVGEPGVGKSRLFHEFIHSHRTRDWLVLEGGSVSYGRSTPYLPVIDLLKAYFRTDPRDDARKTREKVTGKLLTLDHTLEPTLTALLALLDVSIEDPGWQALEPLQRRQRTLDAVKRVLVRESHEQPLLLVFEDLHWIDSETQTVLDSLVESLPTARILLLVNYRPEYEHGWTKKTYCIQLRIDPLPSASAEELLEALLGSDPALGPLKRLLIERTEGNPFFLEESARTLIETRMLVGERGAYRLASSTDRVQVPATVQAVLAARMDRLSPEDKRLLQMAAVVGKDVPFALLQAMADMPDEALRRGLDHLQAGEFVYETGLYPDVEYSFRHALTHEVAYGSLLHDARKTLHGRVLEALERGEHGHAAEQPERLAHHALRGERWEQAARHLYLSGEKAVAGARYRAAGEFYETAVDAIDRQGDLGDPSLKLDTYLELWVTKSETGQSEDLRALAARTQALAEALGDTNRLAQVRLRQAEFYRGSGTTVEEAIQIVTEAFELADAADLRTRSYALTLRAGLYRDLGRLDDSLRMLDAAVTLLSDQTSSYRTPGLVLPIYATARAFQAETFSALGRFDDALSAATDAVRMATDIAHLPSRALASAMLGHVHAEHGHVDVAVPFLELGLSIGAENGFVHSTVAGGIYLAHALALQGRHEGSLATLGQALEAARGGYPLLNVWTKFGSLPATVFLAAGQLSEARAEIERGLSLITERHALGHRASLLSLQAELLTRTTSTGLHHIADLWEEALSLALHMHMRPLVAHCHLGLGRLYQRTGKRQEAQEHLATATTMYREMNMRFYLEQAEAERAALG